jgi:uncharacterized protein YkwD
VIKNYAKIGMIDKDTMVGFMHTKISLIAFVFVLFLFTSCSTGGQVTGISDRTSATAKGANWNRKTTINDSHWDIDELDTARNVSYLSTLEKDIVLELNKARTNPAAYARVYLEVRRQNYEGRLFRRPGQLDLRTKEGRSALEECIRVLRNTEALGPLRPSRGLSRAATDHIKDTGPRGKIGHKGIDGSTISTRVSRYGKWSGYIAENISYGPGEAREIVIQLLVDDGVTSRGHRKNILENQFAYIGVAVGPHKTFTTMCVMDFATVYFEE